MIAVKRVYEPAASSDGMRFLVERLWPRGLRKQSIEMDAWLKEVAPSDALRRWFDHDPVRWNEFRRRYFAELEHCAVALSPILLSSRRGRVTLLYSARDSQYNNAVALKEYVDAARARKAPVRNSKQQHLN